MRTENGTGLPEESRYPEGLRRDFELIERLSAAEESETLLVKDRSSGLLCVAKCFLRTSAFYERSEPEILNRLCTPGIPRYVTEYRSETMRCVLREYIVGETLAEAAARRTFTAEEAVAVGVGICDALSVLHRCDPPVIHRDIKPQNVVLREDGSIVLIDLGISRAVSDRETDTVAYGTQGFAPPEQYGYAQTDARSDIYSLGVLLTWLLTGKAAPPAEVVSPLSKVLARCTAFDPGKRFADVSRVKKALLAALPAARRKRRGLIAAVVCVCAVLAVFLLQKQFAARGVVFAEPLIEESVRLQLGAGEEERLTEEQLARVTGVYVVADRAYADPDTFYPAVNDWYAAGRTPRGGIASLEDLRKLPALEKVCIVAQEISDISVLEELPLLEAAEFKHNEITDISVFAGKTKIVSVGINDNPVTDISPLADCPSLAFLDLCDVRSYDASVLASLGNFNYLDLSNPTDSYRYLAGKNILQLRLAWTGLSDLHVLDEVRGLEGLDISHTDVTDLSPLALHPGLTELKLAALAVPDLSVLLQLPKLREVTLSEEQRPLLDALGEVSFSVHFE